MSKSVPLALPLDLDLTSHEVGSFFSPQIRRAYSMAGAILGLETDDEGLAGRFEAIYGDCRSEGSLTHRCSVATHPHLPLIRINFDQPFEEIASFIAFIFADRHFSIATRRDGWTLLLRDEVPIGAANGEGTVLVTKHEGWQSLVANIAVNVHLRLQQNLLLFHAASCDVNGAGVMVSGIKAAGKTTTALALAAAGHSLLGDEIAALDSSSWVLRPFRRTLSIRDGVRSLAMTEKINALQPPVDLFPDGTRRHRMRISQLCDRASSSVPLRAAFFLRSFADTTRLEPIQPSLEAVRLLQPLGCSLWKNERAGTTIELLRFFHRTRCFWVDAGEPDSVARAIQQTTEAL